MKITQINCNKGNVVVCKESIIKGEVIESESEMIQNSLGLTDKSIYLVKNIEALTLGELKYKAIKEVGINIGDPHTTGYKDMKVVCIKATGISNTTARVTITYDTKEIK